MKFTVEMPEIAAAMLDGRPQHGTPESALPLLSVDDDGWPHVCLLSRAQMANRPGGVSAVITSQQTRRNVVERQVASLVLVAPTAAYYCKFQLLDVIDEPWALTASFQLTRLKVDEAPMGLTPILYTPNPEIEQHEQWDRCEELLDRIA